MFTVIDLTPSGNGVATALNKNGFVAIAAAGFSGFLFIPQSPNSASGTTIGLPSPLNAVGLAAGARVQPLALNNGQDPDVVGWAGFSVSGGTVQLAVAWFASGTGGTVSGSFLPSLVVAPVPSAAQANAINDNRLIAGWSVSSAGVRQAVVWDGSRFLTPLKPLDPLDPALPSEALGLNSGGLVVGSSTVKDASGNTSVHAVSWDSTTGNIVNDFGTLSPLAPAPLPDLNAQATAVNDNGDIVGVGDLTNGSVRMRCGFFIPAGGALRLIGPPHPQAGAWAVSGSGVAGISTPVLKDGSVAIHGGTFTPIGGVVDIDALPEGSLPGGHGLSGSWLLTTALGVNDAGQVCGAGSTPFVSNHALLLTPA